MVFELLVRRPGALKLALAAICIGTAVPADAAGAAALRLRVSDDGRHFVTQDGRPFFYLADTAWELPHRLTREQADEYLTARAAQGFNVIQTVILSEFDGLRVPNAYGELPLHQQDPERPNEKYFAHVDYVVRRANELGLVVALLPTWGDKVRKAWGDGPEIFNAAKARAFGEHVGRRYRDWSVVWVLGGDRDSREYESVWRAMAHGLKTGDGGAHLATFHGAGPGTMRGSAPFFHTDDWLDFNIYVTLGIELTVDLGRLATQPLHAWWFDPRDGHAERAGTWDQATRPQAFNPPGAPGRGNDWVLVLDALAKELSPPGTISQRPGRPEEPEGKGR